MSDSDGGHRISAGLSAALLAVTAVYLVGAFQVRPQVSEGIVGPRFLPITVALMVATAIVWHHFRAAKSGKARTGSLGRPAIIVGLTALYILAFGRAGYAVSTFVYVLSLFAVLDFETGRPLRRAAYASAMTAVFWVLFAVVFGIRLPRLAGLV